MLRIRDGPQSQTAQTKTNTAELNQDGDLIGNKNYQDNEMDGIQNSGPSHHL